MATLLSNSDLKLTWAWKDPLDLSEIVDRGEIRQTAIIDDISTANMVWQDSRTLAASTIETIDLSALPLKALAIEGVVRLTKVHRVYIANTTTDAALTAAGATVAELRVGLPDNGLATSYALSVFQQSHNYLFSRQGWTPTDLLRIGNVSTLPITYDIVLVGKGSVVSA